MISLLEASMDAAMIAPTRTPISATSVEICECPVEYNGTSCQDPNTGFFRWFDRNTTVSSTIIIDIIGKAKACSCNGRSNVCDRETGYCLVINFLLSLQKNYINLNRLRYFIINLFSPL